MPPLVPSNDCTRARRAISAQLDGELSELGLARLSAHLRRCPACALQATELAALVSGLRAAPLERPGRVFVLDRRSRLFAFRISVAAAVAVAAGSVLVVAGVAHQTKQGAAPAGAERASASRHRLMEQRLVAMLSTLDSAPADRQARLVAL